MYSYRLFNQHFIIFTGILLFNDDDLQHMAYWSKDKSTEQQLTALNQFQEVWRYIYHLE